MVSSLTYSLANSHGLGLHQVQSTRTCAGLLPDLKYSLVCIFILLALVLHVVVQVKDPQAYGSHDLRRGHAKDLQKSKHPLATICAMGQWKHGMS